MARWILVWVLVFAAGEAAAKTLRTDSITALGGDSILCIADNHGTKRVELLVELVRFDGVVLSGDTVLINAPGASVLGPIATALRVHCRFSGSFSSSKVRMHLERVSANGVVFVVPAR